MTPHPFPRWARIDARPLVAVSTAVLLAGCWWSDPVEAQWESRERLPSCGSVPVPQGEALEVVADREIACLERALASGEGAELTVTFPTVEGDPITEYHRVLPDGSTEIYTDSTQDTHSDQKWSFGSCAEPQSARDVAC